MTPITSAGTPSNLESFTALYNHLGRVYPCFELKNIDWQAVGEELLPRATPDLSDRNYGLLCLELVARLEDSHALVGKGRLPVPRPPLPQWDPGLACLLDDQHRPVIYYVDPRSPAAHAGLRPGLIVRSVNGVAAEKALTECARVVNRHYGFSSDRYLYYQAARWFLRQAEQNAPTTLVVADTSGKTTRHELVASLGVRYLPRLPVPNPGIADSGNVSFKQLANGVGYIYVRRMRPDLNAQLDQAIAALQACPALMIDVRGNSGGGFDARTAHANFVSEPSADTTRPNFSGPIALLIDARCISAGEGWASWFVANHRARLFGETTAGASSRKQSYQMLNEAFLITVPVKAYHGYLDRPIERLGLEPDVPLRQTAEDLEIGIDTVLKAAAAYLIGGQPIPNDR